MKNILTIAATAGLLSTFAGSAHAQMAVNSPGTVDESCVVTSVNNGTLTQNAIPATSLATGTGAGVGLVKVTCNTITSKLTLSAGAHIIPAQPTAPTVTFGFVGGGDGIYTSVTSGIITPASGDTTLVGGDTAHVASTVTANGGKLLRNGLYQAVVTATVSP
jgi:hypothetical protein